MTTTPRRGLGRPLLVGAGLLALVAVLVLAGLAATSDGAARTPELAGRSFVAVETHGHDLLAGTQVRITFEEAHLSANAGCNTLFGAASWENGVLDAPALASTIMTCSAEHMAQDAWLAEVLSSQPAISLEGGRLTIGDAEAGLVLVEA